MGEEHRAEVLAHGACLVQALVPAQSREEFACHAGFPAMAREELGMLRPTEAARIHGGIGINIDIGIGIIHGRSVGADNTANVTAENAMEVV